MKTIVYLLALTTAFLLPLQLLAQFPTTSNVVVSPSASPVCWNGNLTVTWSVDDDRSWANRYQIKIRPSTATLADPELAIVFDVGTYTAFGATNSMRAAIQLPTSLPGGSYKVTVVAQNNSSTFVNFSNVFTVRPRTTVTISGNQTIIAGTPASINFTFTGTPPFTIDYNDYASEAAPSFLRTQTFNTFTATVTPRMNIFSPQITYNDFFVRNLRDNSGCPGPNLVTGAAIVSATPLELSTSLNRTSVCAGGTLIVTYATANSTIRLQPDFIPLIQLSDAAGNFSAPTDLGTGSRGNVNTTVVIPGTVAAGSNYRVRVISPRADFNALITPRSTPLTITKTVAPSVTAPPSPCQFGTPVTLQASGSGTLNWYDSNGNRQSGTPTQLTGNAGTFGYKVSQTIGGCESDRVDVNVTIKPKSRQPTVDQTITRCQNQQIDQLSTSDGPNLIWYDSNRNSLGSEAPRPSTSTPGQQTFFVSRDENGCRSDLTQITVNINALPDKPGVSNPGAVCQYKEAQTLSATGNELRWYRQETGGNAEGSIKPNTDRDGTTSFWVSQVVNGCEGGRAKVDQLINPASPPPTVSSPKQFCQRENATSLTATGQQLRWYNDDNSFIGTDGPRPPTDQVRDMTYKVTQNSNGCESQFTNFVVQVRETPGAPVLPDLPICHNAPAPTLSIQASDPLWYSAETGGTGTGNAPVISTAQVGDQAYWVSQRFGACEGPRAKITIKIIALPQEPVVNTPPPICQYVDVPVLTAQGQNLRWYRQVTGGTAENQIKPGSGSEGKTSFWVSQVVNNCEGPRARIEQTINPASPNPTTTTLPLCRDQATQDLTAGGQNLRWYDGGGSFIGTTAPQPPTGQVRDILYKVSQNSNGCESQLVDLLVQVRDRPGAPGVTARSLCQNQPAQPLTANGTGSSLLWYDQATGGTSTTSLTPQTTTLGERTYWVSERFGVCEGPRAALLTTVYAVPAAPTATGRTYCIGDTPTALTATGQNLRWYDGSGTSQASVVPSTTTGQSLSYVVTQTQNGCESAGQSVIVRILSRATVRLTGDSASVLYDSTAIRLRFGGDAPWRVRLWDGSTITTSTSPYVKWVRPTQAGTASYAIQAIDNDCGAGQILNTYQLIVLTPLAIEPPQTAHADLRVYPVPASEEATIEWLAPSGTAVTLQLINAMGQVSWQDGRLGTGSRQTERIDLRQQPGGPLILRLLTDSQLSRSIRLLKL
ncbi:hypothetical protein [Fibrella aquatica]|uniref:Ig-like domain-containing protein n=1 Tax=Fibrella aquatica TaxID=3242487 RepID=UPI003520EEE7